MSPFAPLRLCVKKMNLGFLAKGNGICMTLPIMMLSGRGCSQFQPEIDLVGKLNGAGKLYVVGIILDPLAMLATFVLGILAATSVISIGSGGIMALFVSCGTIVAAWAILLTVTQGAAIQAVKELMVAAVKNCCSKTHSKKISLD